MRLTPLLFALGTLPLMAVPIANASFETATLTTTGTVNGSYNNLIAGSTISASGGTLSNWNVKHHRRRKRFRRRLRSYRGW